MTVEVSPEIKVFLNQLFGDDVCVLTQVNNGGTNRHYQVVQRDTKKQYFLKVFLTNSLQVVDRQQQFSIQQQLAIKGLAPAPVALSSCKQYWLEQWHQPSVLVTNGEKEIKSSVSVLAGAMAKVHESNVLAADLDLEVEWLRYLDVAGIKSKHYLNRINSLISAFGSRDIYPEDFCFCHNDLHFSHIIDVEPLCIVDWEYSAVGNRYFDIAACAMVNEFDKKKLDAFIDQYSTYTRIPISLVASGVERLLPVVDFTNELWHNAYSRLTKNK